MRSLQISSIAPVYGISGCASHHAAVDLGHPRPRRLLHRAAECLVATRGLMGADAWRARLPLLLSMRIGSPDRAAESGANRSDGRPRAGEASRDEEATGHLIRTRIRHAPTGDVSTDKVGRSAPVEAAIERGG